MTVGARTVLIILLAPLTPALPGQERATPTSRPALVALLGDVDRIVFTGLRTFSAEELRVALVGQDDWFAVTRPSSPREPFLRWLEERLALGYRHLGFPDPRVSARVDAEGQRLLVTVAEGRRLVSGTLLVTGVGEASREAIVRALTLPRAPPGEDAVRVPIAGLEAVREVDSDTKSPWWRPGAPPRLDELSRETAHDLVRVAFAERGFLRPDFRISVVPEKEGSGANLEVEVAREGVESRIERWELEGDHTDDAEQIARWAALAKGMPADLAGLRAIVERLRDTGRFVSIELGPIEPSASGLIDPLRIRLEQARFAPPLAEMPWEDLGTLKKGSAWLKARLADVASLSLRYHVRRHDDLPGGLTLGAGTLEAVGGGRGFLVAIPLRREGRPFGPCVIACDGQSLRIFVDSENLRWQVSLPAESRVGFRLKLDAVRGPDAAEFGSAFGYHFVFRLNQQEPFECVSTSVHPAALLYQLTRLRVRPAAGTASSLVLRHDGENEVLLSIDRRTGESSLRAEGTDLEGQDYEVLLPGPSMVERFAEFERQWNRQGVRDASLLELLSSLLPDARPWTARTFGIEETRVSELVASMSKDLFSGEVAEGSGSPAAGAGDDAFWIPFRAGETAHSWDVKVLRSLARRLTRSYPPGSWPRVLFTELFALRIATTREERKGPVAELERVFKETPPGPLGCFLFAEALRFVDVTSAGKTFAEKGLARATAARFCTDVEALVPPDTRAGARLERAARALTRESGRPETVRDFLTRLWDGGLDRVLATRLRELAK